MKTLPGGAFIRRGHLKEGGIHKIFLILGGVFIWGRHLKEGGHLLEDLLYFMTCKKLAVRENFVEYIIALLQDLGDEEANAHL